MNLIHERSFDSFQGGKGFDLDIILNKHTLRELTRRLCIPRPWFNFEEKHMSTCLLITEAPSYPSVWAQTHISWLRPPTNNSKINWWKSKRHGNITHAIWACLHILGGPTHEESKSGAPDHKDQSSPLHRAQDSAEQQTAKAPWCDKPPVLTYKRAATHSVGGDKS